MQFARVYVILLKKYGIIKFYGEIFPLKNNIINIMDKAFNKNEFRLSNQKVKIIIDTDPGVDDIACLIYAMNDENIEIELLTTVAGNLSLKKATRNLLHTLDLFNADYPVATGATRALKRKSPTAEFIHSKEGLGGYIPPKTVKRTPNSNDAVEEMYKTFMNGNGDIVPLMLGPVTNLALLLLKHPDVKTKIPKIVVMGGAPYGNKDYPEHTSFNLSTDPEAFKILLDSKIPILMCPSHMGRIRAHLEEEFVLDLQKQGEVGNFLYTMYSKYWEPNYPTKRITTNDSCAMFALVYPKIFQIKKATVTVDTDKFPGRTHIDFTENGNVEFIDDLNKPAFLSLLLSELDDMKNIKLNM